MNRLEIPDGGMPFHGDDIRFIDEGVREALKGLIHLYAAQNGGNMILSGMEYTNTGGQVSINEGFVCLNYEVRYFPASNVSVSNTVGALQALNIQPDNYYQSEGNDVFEDGVSRDTYAIRRAKIVNGLTDSNDFPLVGAWSMAKAIREIVIPEQKETITDFVGSWSSTETVVVNLIGEQAVLSGRISSGNTNNNVFSIPQTHRPTVDVFLPVVMLISGASQLGMFKVSSSGACAVYSNGSEITLSNTDYVSLSGLTWVTY